MLYHFRHQNSVDSIDMNLLYPIRSGRLDSATWFDPAGWESLGILARQLNFLQGWT